MDGIVTKPMRRSANATVALYVERSFSNACSESEGRTARVSETTKPPRTKSTMRNAQKLYVTNASPRAASVRVETRNDSWPTP